MKKEVLLLCVLLLSMFSATGCGKAKNGEVLDGAIVFGEVATGLDEWSGGEAIHNFGDALQIQYYLCSEGPGDCMHNLAGVTKENMSRYKKAYYYALYLDTEVYMYYPCSGGYIEGVGYIRDESRYNKTQVVEIMHNDMASMYLSENITEVTYEGKVTLNVSDWGFKARPNELIIPSLIRVKKDDNSITMTSTMQINGVTVGHAVSESYEYYKYSDILIQAVLGADIASYVKIKEAK